MELFKKAAALGHVSAHNNIGNQTTEKQKWKMKMKMKEKRGRKRKYFSKGKQDNKEHWKNDKNERKDKKG